MMDLVARLLHTEAPLFRAIESFTTGTPNGDFDVRLGTCLRGDHPAVTSTNATPTLWELVGDDEDASESTIVAQAPAPPHSHGGITILTPLPPGAAFVARQTLFAHVRGGSPVIAAFVGERVRPDDPRVKQFPDGFEPEAVPAPPPRPTPPRPAPVVTPVAARPALPPAPAPPRPLFPRLKFGRGDEAA